MKKIYLSLLTSLIFLAPLFLVAATGIQSAVTFKGEMAQNLYNVLMLPEVNADQNESDFEGKISKKEILGLNCYLRDDRAESEYDCIFDSTVADFQQIFEALSIESVQTVINDGNLYTKAISGFSCTKSVTTSAASFVVQYSCDVNL